jgi:hypothetical protein
MEKIFVSIAAYRDPELLPTIKNLLENAELPNLLKICIGWQHSKDDKWDNLDEYKNDERFIIIDVPYTEAKGVCWMRCEIQKEITDETYYLQLDSHHRFIKNWDTILKDWINYFRSISNSKPILTSYLPSYFPNLDPQNRTDEVWGINVQRFMPEGVLFLEPFTIQNYKELKEPFPARFISAHMIFSEISFPQQVPYDPDLYFHGEESSLAARAYTYGYDLYSPHFPIIWHEYTREGKRKHWDDSSDWSERDRNSYAKYRKIMGVDADCSSCQRSQIIKEYFGQVRSFEDYEKYIGIKFQTRQIHIETIKNENPPIKGNFEEGLTNKQKYCIDVYKGDLVESDYNLFAVAFIDKNGDDIFRKDADEKEIFNLLNENKDDKFIHIWRDFQSVERPYAWKVWPHSISKGWTNVIEQIIKYE